MKMILILFLSLLSLNKIYTECEINLYICVDNSGSINDYIVEMKNFLKTYHIELKKQAKKIKHQIFNFSSDAEAMGPSSYDELTFNLTVDKIAQRRGSSDLIDCIKKVKEQSEKNAEKNQKNLFAVFSDGAVHRKTSCLELADEMRRNNFVIQSIAFGNAHQRFLMQLSDFKNVDGKNQKQVIASFTDFACQKWEKCTEAPALNVYNRVESFDSCKNVLNSSVCDFSCKMPYAVKDKITCVKGKWKGINTKMCVSKCPTGTSWDTKTQRCKRNNLIKKGCTQRPHFATNKGIKFTGNCANVEHGEICLFACKKEFVVKDQIVCTNGEWKSVEPCVKTFCKKPEKSHFPSIHPISIFLNCERIPKGGRCDFECGTNFKKSGYLSCDDNFEWKGVEAVCESICPEAPKIKNSVIEEINSCKESKTGIKCLVKCQPGYKKVGENPQCMPGGEWNLEGTYCYQNCNKQPEINKFPGISSFKNCDNVQHDEICPFTCEEEFVAKDQIVCTNGEWKSVEPCTKAFCKTPETSHFPNIHPISHFLNCERIPKGGRCDFECGTNFKKSGYLSCDDNFEWKGVEAVCESICPEAPKIENSVIEEINSCKESKTGIKCPVKCQPGYKKVGENPQCMPGGEWNLEGTHCYQACNEEPDINNLLGVSELKNCVNVGHGEICIFACKEEFVAKDQIVCTNGEWKSIEPCVKTFCKTPEISHFPNISNISKIGDCKSKRKGQKCDFECETKYKKSGFLSCDDNFEWKGVEAVCESICPEAPKIENSVIQEINSCKESKTGSKCSLVCREGFEKFGQDPICMSNHNWNSLFSFCLTPSKNQSGLFASSPSIFSSVSSLATMFAFFAITNTENELPFNAVDDFDFIPYDEFVDADVMDLEMIIV